MTLQPGDKFVDISSNNDPADIAAYAAAGYNGIAIKCTEGGSYTYFEGNAHHVEAHKHGLVVGRYAWPRPDGPSAIVQADYFVDAVKAYLKPGDFVFPDWETSYVYATGKPAADPPEATWAKFMKAFTKRIRSRLAAELDFPVPLVLYTANWYLDGKSHMIRLAKKFRVIIADYVSPAGKPNNRLGLNILAHQFTSSATIAGFPRPVDCNVMIQPLVKESHVSIVNTARVLRAVILGGKYATPALKKKYPTMVNEQGVLGVVKQLRKDSNQHASQIAKLSAEVEALKKSSTPKAHHAAEAKAEKGNA